MQKITERVVWSPEFVGKLKFYQPVFHDDKMKHFALIGPDNKVVLVNIVYPENCLDSNNLHSESIGIQFCNNFWGTPDGHIWKETFRNDQGRGYYATIGSTWDSEKQIFIVPQPFKGWVLDENGYWETPTAKPLGSYAWNENIEDWSIATEYHPVTVDGYTVLYDSDGYPVEIDPE